MSDHQAANAADDAVAVLDAFIRDHHAAAIPALIGAAVLWAVEHGGTDVVKGSLRRAIKMADEMERERRRTLA